MADFNTEKLEAKPTNQENVKPYQILDKLYYSPEELAVGLAENWEEGIKDFVRGKVSDWIKKEFNDNNLFQQILDIEQDYYGNNTKLLLGIATLNPQLQPTYQGYTLSEEGLRTLISKATENQESKESEVLYSLYKESTLKIYGTLKDNKLYKKWGEDWENQVLQYSELLKELPDSIKRQISLLNQEDIKILSTLLLHCISPKETNQRSQDILENLDQDAYECQWLENLLPENNKASPTAGQLLLIEQISQLAIDKGKEIRKKREEEKERERNYIEKQKQQEQEKQEKQVRAKMTKIAIVVGIYVIGVIVVLVGGGDITTALLWPIALLIAVIMIGIFLSLVMS